MDKVDEIAALLSEAAETHAMVYRLTDGEDPDWASWYAKWLIELSELPDVLGDEPVRSHLVYELVRLEREYAEVETDEPWELYYAAQLLEEFQVEESDEDEDGDEELDGETDEFDEDDEEFEDEGIEDDVELDETEETDETEGEYDGEVRFVYEGEPERSHH